MSASERGRLLIAGLRGWWIKRASPAIRRWQQLHALYGWHTFSPWFCSYVLAIDKDALERDPALPFRYSETIKPHALYGFYYGGFTVEEAVLETMRDHRSVLGPKRQQWHSAPASIHEFGHRGVATAARERHAHLIAEGEKLTQTRRDAAMDDTGRFKIGDRVLVRDMGKTGTIRYISQGMGDAPYYEIEVKGHPERIFCYARQLRSHRGKAKRKR